jgi:hypothetical protein
MQAAVARKPEKESLIERWMKGRKGSASSSATL